LALHHLGASQSAFPERRFGAETKNTGRPVDDKEYQVPFTGRIAKLTIPPKLTPEDEKKLTEAYRAAQDAK
jgi:hypothetical protein